MRYSTEHKELTRKKILAAAAALFRGQGYAGLGIDALAKAAGVTNGAFYGHFASKAEAYRATVESGLETLWRGIEAYRADHGPGWITPFAHFYFGTEKIGCSENLCALPAFGPEIARAPAETRAAFDAGLARVHRALAEGLSGADAEARAWRLLALMLGGVTLARAVPDATLARRLAEDYAQALIAAAQPPAGAVPDQ